MKKNEILLRSISEIDDDLIAEAAIVKKASIFDLEGIKRYGTIAAALFLVIASTLVISNLFSDQVKGGAAGGNSSPELDYSDRFDGSEDDDSTEEEDADDKDETENEHQKE